MYRGLKENHISEEIKKDEKYIQNIIMIIIKLLAQRISSNIINILIFTKSCWFIHIEGLSHNNKFTDKWNQNTLIRPI